MHCHFKSAQNGEMRQKHGKTAKKASPNFQKRRNELSRYERGIIPEKLWENPSQSASGMIPRPLPDFRGIIPEALWNARPPQDATLRGIIYITLLLGRLPIRSSASHAILMIFHAVLEPSEAVIFRAMFFFWCPKRLRYPRGRIFWDGIHPHTCRDISQNFDKIDAI